MTKSILKLLIMMLAIAPTALSGQISVGGSIPDQSAALDMQSADKGFLLPRMTTAERNNIPSPATGLMIFNTTTLCMEINEGSPASPGWSRVVCRAGSINNLDCNNARINGSVISVPYTGGNSGAYDAQAVPSAVITGLTAALSEGNLAAGADSLLWTVSGAPSGVGTASFTLSFAGQSCTVAYTVSAASVSALNCAASGTYGLLVSGVTATGVRVRIPYTGGNGGYYPAQSLASSGVTGLTATLTEGLLKAGADSLTYHIAGIPNNAGNADFLLNIGGQSCTLTLMVASGAVTTLNCSNAIQTGTLVNGQAASGVSVSVPYTGGNGGPHSGQTVASAGVTGLTATLTAGIFASGPGSLSYTITGTPASAGTAVFALNIGGKTCSLTVTAGGAAVCRARVNPSTYKNFMCYNLGTANTNADPFTPSWEIIGGYWQWGRIAQAAPGPTGPASSQSNSDAISGWNLTYPPNGSWSDVSKTANDPCPAGYRVPTRTEWDNVSDNNTKTNVGAFTNSSTNYSSGKWFGTQLMLPMTGARGADSGILVDRGIYGDYWSSTEGGLHSAWIFGVDDTPGSATYVFDRREGHPVRCIEQ